MLLIRSRYIAIYEVTTEGILPNMVIYSVIREYRHVHTYIHKNSDFLVVSSVGLIQASLNHIDTMFN